ncbi:MAG: ABC transporter permease [Acidobacteria bacterium]|nr:MAG: ABC transporter permease [Acidobacteriota bacterium]
MVMKAVFENALAALRFYKRRSIITMISLAWAVASFLILMGYGEGFHKAMTLAFRAVGQELIILDDGQTSLQAGGMRSGRAIRLEEKDADIIRENVPLVAAISPELMLNVSVVRGDREKQYMARAVAPEYELIRNMKLDGGRWLSDDDNRYRRRVAVIGASVYRELFKRRQFLDEEITLNGVTFTVIGRLATKVQFANYNRPDNECVFIPYQTGSMFGQIRYPNLIVWAPLVPTMTEKAIEQVRETLAGIHRFSPKDEKAVFTLAFSKYTNLVDGMSVALEILLAFIGTVTLAIGGVGLANIMYTSVLERTTEIGVQKALGARRRTVLFQFLSEAVVIVLLGAICGVSLGVAIASAIGSLPFLGNLMGEEIAREYGRLYFEISASSIIVSVGVLFLVGLIAGLLPALRASRLDPIKALHYE